MGFFDELKKLAQPYGGDEEEFFDSGTPQEEAGPPIVPAERRESFFTDEEEAEPANISLPKPSFHLPKRGERVQTKRETAQQPAAQAQSGGSGFMLAKPKEFADCTGIADSFALGKTIMLDLSQADKVTSRRALDFLAGVAYTRNGKLNRVSGMIYLITPAGVDVTGEMMSQIESGGLYF